MPERKTTEYFLAADDLQCFAKNGPVASRQIALQGFIVGQPEGFFTGPGSRDP
jgi:hypothetical protein